MAQTILYYPNININDGQWLRNALLYWDNISSIVPYDNYGDLSSELLFLQDSGIYEPIYPQDLFCSEYVDDFCKAIVKRISIYEKGKARNFSRAGAGKVRIHKEKIYAPALHTLIHYRKLPPELLDYFTDKKYINDYNTDGWMEIDEKIARIYMRTLAEYSIKCSDKDIVLGTDKVVNSREIYHSTKHRPDTQCCHLNIIDCLPQPSKNVSFEEIIDFKIRRADELNAFRQKIYELEQNIYRSQTIEEIKFHENRFIEGWENCSNDYYKALKDAKISFVLGSLNTLIAIPSVEDLLSKHIGQEWVNGLQIFGGLLQVGVSYIDYKNKISLKKSDGGFSYVINARKNGLIKL